MEHRTLKWLDISEMKIIKHIIIVSDSNNGKTELGSIIYTRLISDTYKFQKENKEKEKDLESRISRCLKGYPNQKNYPSDLIDEIILSSVQKTYPKSFLRNDTIFLNVDKEKLDNLKKRTSFNSKIYFSPEFPQFDYYGDYVGKEFKAPVVSVKIYRHYGHYRPEFPNGQVFYADYDATNPDSLNRLEELNFE